jgi:ABC-2 type transport system permease protein
MNAILAIVRANLLRLFAERSNLFFLVALPLLIVFALGVAIGGSGDYRVGVVDLDATPTSDAVRAQVAAADGVEVVRVDSVDALRDDVARRTLDMGWVVRSGPDGTTYEWLAPASGDGLELRGILTSAVQEQDVDQRVTTVVTESTGASDAHVEEALAAASAAAPPTQVEVSNVGSGQEPASIRAVLAAGQLTLFIFLSSLTGAAYLLTTRQLGVTRRTRAAPVPVGAIIAGEALSRFIVAMLQAGIVFFGSMLFFGVDWRSPLAVGLLCVAMSLVGTGAAMLLGTLGRSEQQVGAIGLLLGLVLAALGGSMQPLEFFPDGLRRVAFLTPHAWMNDALWRILIDGSGLAQVWPALAVLAGAGTALLALAATALARSLR